MDYVLKTNNLTKKFKDIKAVNEVSMSVKKGDIYGFIGKNGAGKSSFMKMVCGMFIPSSGEIELFGNADLVRGRKKIGSIIESPAFYPSMTAEENLRYYSIVTGQKKYVKLDETLKFVGLTGFDSKKVAEFSLGMKQRLAIAIAFSNSAEFLVLDEPVNGLDPTGIKEIRELLLRLNEEKGITILISSHILGELSKIATKYGVIDKGILVDEFDSNELTERCKKYIKIEVDNMMKASHVLSEQMNIQKFEMHNSNTIKIYDNLENVALINRNMVLNDINVSYISIQGMDLEDYFVRLMEGIKC